MNKNTIGGFMLRFNLGVAVAVVLCMLTGVASAAARTVTWTLPTTNTDGSSLPASQITRTTVYWGTSQTAMANSRAITGAATTTTIDLAPGTWYVGAKTTANGNESAMSNVVQVVISQPTPNPPTLSVVPVIAGLNMSPVYAIAADGTGARIVKGFADLGTPCSGRFAFRYRNRDYHEIPSNRVKWWSPTLADVQSPPAVAAPCA